MANGHRQAVPKPGATLLYDLFVPPGGEGRPLIVVVHGARSQSVHHLQAMRPGAAVHGRALMAPSFHDAHHRGFQKLAAAGVALGAASAFDAAVAGAAARLGHPSAPIDLIGFSGGAQFAHRYALLFPSHVRRLVVVSAGWYTYLDPTRPFPEGIAPSATSASSPVDVDAFLAIPTLVAVGERDVGRSALLRSNDTIDAQQGEHRLARAVRWREHLLDAARARGVGGGGAELAVLSGTGHSFDHAVARGRLGESAMAFLSRTGVT